MAHFELWERETLNEFAREARRKLVENQEEIERLRRIEEEARNLVVQAGLHCELPALTAELGNEIARHLRQLAPHQREREAARLLRDALEGLQGLARYAQHQQARIDALMLEYCPDEMTPEQIAEWERHQRPVPNVEVRGCPHNEQEKEQ